MLPWQTKTHKTIKDSVPLICPTHSFSGLEWWTPFIDTCKHLSTLSDEVDFLLPATTSKHTAFYLRPCSYQQSLRWLHRILLEQGHNPIETATLTLHSLRVFMADLAYTHNVSSDLRKYIGRWTNSSTADIYTRDHRTAILNIWSAVTKGNTAIASTHDPRPPVTTLESELMQQWQHAVNSAPSGHPGTDGTSTTDLPTTDTYPTDKGGPLTVAVNAVHYNIPANNSCRTHFLSTQGRCIGCSWTPRPEQYIIITCQEDWERESNRFALCTNATKRTSLPKNWTTHSTTAATHDTDSVNSDSIASSISEADAEEPTWQLN